MPIPFGFFQAEAHGVSDSGTVVGLFGTDGTGTGRAFRWDAHGAQVLELLPGAVTSKALGVNSAGIICGETRFFPVANAVYAATIWTPDGNVKALPLLDGYSSGRCVAINELGVILGTVSKPTVSGLPSSQDVVWIDSVPQAIEPLIDAVNPTAFGSAFDINDLGEVIGTGQVPAGVNGGAWLLAPAFVHFDTNGDCLVNSADIANVLGDWGSTALPASDVNQDGLVDGQDIAAVLGAWSTSRQAFD